MQTRIFNLVPIGVLSLLTMAPNGTKGKWSLYLLDIYIVKVILTELYTGLPVRRVELVRYVPAQRPKLSSLLKSYHNLSTMNFTDRELKMIILMTSLHVQLWIEKTDFER